MELVDEMDDMCPECYSYKTECLDIDTNCDDDDYVMDF